MPPENSAAAPSKTWLWYVIGGVVVLIILAFIFMRGPVSLMGSGIGADQNIDGSTTYTDQQGNTATVGGNSMPENWPSDAPANYAGASIQYSGNSNPQSGTAGAAVVYTVNASVQSVVDYYKAQLSSKGWTIVGTANVGGATVLSATKDERSFATQIVSNGSSVTVTAGIEL